MKSLRLHFANGKVIVESLHTVARANGLSTPNQAKALIARWIEAGDLGRRPDGGFDVVHHRPRPDKQRIAEAGLKS